MSEKISEYITSVTALASGDLMDVSKLISTSPLDYQSQKLNYSVLISELNNDLTINNLGNSDLTSTDNARYFKLNGTTSSNFLKFRNSSNISILSLFGDKSIVFGNIGNPVSINFNIDAADATGDLWYRNVSGNLQRLPIGSSSQVLTVAGGLPSWATVSAPNLGSANLTSTDDARTFTLKSGGTASQNLQFLNSGGGNLLKLSGNKAIDFGSSANTITPKIYLDAYAPDKFSLFSNVSSFSFCDVYSDGNGQFDLKNLNGNVKIEMNAGVGSGAYLEKAEMNLRGAYSSFRIFNSIANNAVELTSGSADYGQLYLNSVSGANKTYLSASYSIIDTSLKVGGSFAGATAALQIVGAGSTSATTTALFQNSSSVAALKVKDDGYCILKANNAAIASGDLANNEMSFYIDEGTNHCVVKVKYSSGTVKTGTFNLT
jgi:hypothetical protein